MKRTLNGLAVTNALCRPAAAQMTDPEKDELTFGFIRLADRAPLAVAHEQGYVLDEGLTIEAQANWTVSLDEAIGGQPDGAHMLAGQPRAATIGSGTEAHIVTPFCMDLNGNGITVSTAGWEEMKPDIPGNAEGPPRAPTPSAEILDAVPCDGRAPDAYPGSLPIGRKGAQTVVGNEVRG